MDSEPILKKTLKTVATMVSVWAAFMGTVTLVAVFATAHAVGSTEGKDSPASETVTTPHTPAVGGAHAPPSPRAQAI
ncbi:MAG TPA: hypothetical protein VGI39_42290 [Polyangiaceae bacterium]|jgi:hypothetical protein